MSIELIQFKLIWYKEGDEIYQDVEDGFVLFSDPSQPTTIVVETGELVKKKEVPPKLVDQVDLQEITHECYIVASPFLLLLPMVYLTSDGFSGIENEVQNLSREEVFEIHLPDILKLFGTHGHQLPDRHVLREGSKTEVLTTVWSCEFHNDEDGGEWSFDLEGAIIVRDIASLLRKQ